MKDLKELNKLTNEELINTNSEDGSENNIQDEEDTRRLNFAFYPTKQKYIYNPQYNE